MATQLPNDFQQATIIMRYEFLKYLRGKKILVFVALLALILGLLTAMPYLLGDGLPSDPKDFMLLYLGFSTILIILAVTLFGADSIASEFEHRTGLLLLPRPLKREALFAGKFMASFLVSAVMISIYYLVVFILSYAITGGIVSDAYTSLGVALLYVLAATGFGFMLSSFMARGNTAAILLFATLLLIFPIIDSVFMLAEIEPVFSLSYSGDAAYNAVAGLVTEDSFGWTIYYAQVGTAAVVLTAWAILTTMIAALKFKRREF